MAVRWVLPRFRYDQIQKLCWKILLPASLANVFITGAAVLYDPSLRLLAWIGVATLVAIGAITAAASRGAPAPAHDAHAAAGH
jgi:NADH-quinone oxidoreductase subunit H